MFGLSFSKDDAITLLTADHRKVDALFRELEREDDTRRKVEIATTICNELTVHALAEEQLFYPEALPHLERDDKGTLIWEATIEHGTLEGLIDAVTGVRGDDPAFDAHMKVLKEYVKHHVREEENELFPAVRRTDLDLQDLGDRIVARKLELRKQMKLPADPDEVEAATAAEARRAA